MNLELSRQSVSATGVVIDDDDTKFAYLSTWGVGINLQELGLFSTVALFDGIVTPLPTDFSLQARDGTNRNTDFSSHAVMFGFRKQF